MPVDHPVNLIDTAGLIVLATILPFLPIHPQQADSLASTDIPDEARRRRLDSTSALQRKLALVDQLLALVHRRVHADRLKRRCSQEAVRSVFEDLYPLAEAKHTDLGVIDQHDERVSPIRWS